VGAIPRSFHYFSTGQGESFRILLFDEDKTQPPVAVLTSGRPPVPAGPDVRSDAFTASVNEPCDSGADYSTFDFFRRGEIPPIPKDPFGLPNTTERFVRPSKDYAWSSVVDHMAIEQAVGISQRWYDVLVHLEESPQGIPMNELAERILYSKSGFTRVVDRMEKAELVRRVRPEHDRRSILVVLTDKGTETMEHARRHHRHGIEQHFSRHLSDTTTTQEVSK